jgi:hypothetical protein
MGSALATARPYSICPANRPTLAISEGETMDVRAHVLLDGRRRLEQRRQANESQVV